MSILHTVNKSPFDKGTLTSCLNHVKEGDGVLLIEDAVYGVLSGTKAADAINAAKGKIVLYALGPDLEARGLAKDRLIDGIQIVDYAGFVELVAKHDITQAWL